MTAGQHAAARSHPGARRGTAGTQLQLLAAEAAIYVLSEGARAPRASACRADAASASPRYDINSSAMRSRGDEGGAAPRGIHSIYITCIASYIVRAAGARSYYS